MMLRVTSVESLTPVIKQFRLVAAGHSEALPGYEAGAHVGIEVHPAGGAQWRSYSLVSFSPNAADRQSPAEYVVAVRLDERGRGGSRFLHEQVKAGGVLRVKPPRNDFRLASKHGPVLLIAGGIGITPLATMAATLCGGKQPVRMFFAGRDHDSLAYTEPLKSILGDRLRLHADEETGGPPDMASVLGQTSADTDIYVCGPQPMLAAVLAAARIRGLAPASIHFEMFSPPGGQLSNRSFEVLLARSGRRLHVAPDQTLLQALNQAGCDVPYDCERGECGVCRVAVIEGAIDHRDYSLSERERADGRLMQTCVSRSVGDRLVLDL